MSTATEGIVSEHFWWSTSHGPQVPREVYYFDDGFFGDPDPEAPDRIHAGWAVPLGGKWRLNIDPSRYHGNGEQLFPTEAAALKARVAALHADISARQGRIEAMCRRLAQL